MKKLTGIALFTLVSMGSPALADEDDVRVLTFNQYLGADFAGLAAAENAQQFNDILVGILGQIAATEVPERLQRQAILIAWHKPDLVGLQEVWSLDCQGEACGHPTIADAFSDHLDLTLDALGSVGAGYEAVASVRNLDVTLPFVMGGLSGVLQATDHDVILARSKTVSYVAPMVFPDCDASLDGCNYRTSLPVALPFGQVEFPRGFVAVDATVRGRDYVFVNTHLEVKNPMVPAIVQALQASELIERLDSLAQVNPFTPIIVVGDINSSPEDDPALASPFGPPYQQFVTAGYHDVWALRRRAAPGFTCCQAPDLRNRRSMLDERIDMIFSLEEPEAVRHVRLVGDIVFSKTWPFWRGLWPSDHAGVAASLELD